MIFPSMTIDMEGKIAQVCARKFYIFLFFLLHGTVHDLLYTLYRV